MRYNKVSQIDLCLIFEYQPLFNLTGKLNCCDFSSEIFGSHSETLQFRIVWKTFSFELLRLHDPPPQKYIQSVKAFLSWDESERPPVWSHTLLTPGLASNHLMLSGRERTSAQTLCFLRRRLISLTCCFYGLLLIDVGTVTFTQMDVWSIQWISKNLVEEWQTETERLKFWGRVREATWFLYSAIVLFGSQAPWLTVGCIRLLSVLEKKKASSRTKVMKTLGWRLNKWL